MYCLDRDVKKQFAYSISYPSFSIPLTYCRNSKAFGDILSV